MTPVRQGPLAVPESEPRKPPRGAASARRAEATAAAALSRPTATTASTVETASGKAIKKRGSARRTREAQLAPPSTKIAQVRLQPDEVAALETVVQRLKLSSTSEALREGLRLLVREAAEVQAAEEIRTFYEGEQVPLPYGVVPATEAELRAADETRW